MISIIIPIFNQADKLGKCLASIVAQTYQDFEVIIVNDGSDDNPEKVFKLFEQQLGDRAVFIVQENQGSNPSRNRGAREAKGEYLLFCDADTILKPDMLVKLLNKLNDNQGSAYAYSSFRFGWKMFYPGEFTLKKLQTAPFIHTMALMRADKFPGFDEKIKRFQDWDLWLTMSEQGSYGIYVDEVLFTVAGGGTISSWLPSFAYKYLPWLKQVQKYQSAEAIIKQKHGL